MTRGAKSRAWARQLLMSVMGAALAAFAATPLAAQCVLAPVHGQACRYVDIRLEKSTETMALQELMRWRLLIATKARVRELNTELTRSEGVILRYDSLLRKVQTPRASLNDVFRTAFVLQHPSARVTVRFADGKPRVVAVDSFATAAVARVFYDTAKHPMTRYAEMLYRAEQAEGRGDERIIAKAYQVFLDGYYALPRDSQFTAGAAAFGARVRAQQGRIAGDRSFAFAEGQILAAKGALDAMTGQAELARLESGRGALRAIRRAQEADSARVVALRRWYQMHAGARP